MCEMACELGCKRIQGQTSVPSQGVISVIDGRTVVLCTKCHSNLARARYDHPSYREFETLTARREVILATLSSSSAGGLTANLTEEAASISDRLSVLRRELFEFVENWLKSTVAMKSP